MSSTAPATEPQVSAEGSVRSQGSLLRMIRDGRLPPPPAAQLLGLDLVDVRYGHVGFNFDAATRFDNCQTIIHGGVLAAVVDFAVSTAVLTGVHIGTTMSVGDARADPMRASEKPAPSTTRLDRSQGVRKVPFLPHRGVASRCPIRASSKRGESTSGARSKCRSSHTPASPRDVRIRASGNAPIARP